MNNQKIFVVAVWPFENYPDVSFFMARKELDINWRVLDKYFFLSATPETRCNFEEARMVVSRFQTRFPGKKCKTYSIRELKIREI